MEKNPLNMDKKGLKTATKSELESLEKNLLDNLFKLKIQKSVGQLLNTAEIKKYKKQIARIKTFLAVKV